METLINIDNGGTLTDILRVGRQRLHLHQDLDHTA